MADPKNTPIVAADEMVAAQNVDVELSVEFRTNGQAYGPGVVRVHPEIAEDLKRRQAEYDQVERERLISRTYTIDGGSLDAAGK